MKTKIFIKIGVILLISIVIASTILSITALYAVDEIDKKKISPHFVGESNIVLIDQDYDKNNNIFQRSYFDIESQTTFLYTFFWKANDVGCWELEDINILQISKSGYTKTLKE